MHFATTTTVAALILCGSICAVESNQQNTNKQQLDNNVNVKPKKTPQGQVEFGSFLLDVFYNETKLKDKLRLSKSYVKLSTNKEATSNSLFQLPMSIRLSRLEELVRCENLNLTQSPNVMGIIYNTDHTPLLDCKPLEMHIFDKVEQKQLTPNPVDYVKRSSIRLKDKFIWNQDENTRKNLMLYPLRSQVVQDEIDSNFASLNVTNFEGTPNVMGYYFELSLGPNPDSIQCVGQIYLSINQTTEAGQSTPREHSFPQFVDEFKHTSLRAYENGFFVRIKDADCWSGTTGLFFTPKTDFTFLYRRQFPFITCKHSIQSSPTPTTWRYEGSIIQTLTGQSPSGQLAYNTTIKMKSESDLVEMLRFSLDQTFVNEDFTKGFEDMVFVNPTIASVVTGNWTADSLVKIAEFYQMDPINFSIIKPYSTLSTISPAAFVQYEDKPDNEYVQLNFNVKRGFFESLPFFRPVLQDYQSSTPTPFEHSEEFKRTEL